MNEYDNKLAEWKAKAGYRTPEQVDDEQDQATRAADRLRKGDDYCVYCGHGPQPISGMCLVTREDDPYVQMEDDDEDEDGLPVVARACPKCWQEEHGPEPEATS